MCRGLEHPCAHLMHPAFPNTGWCLNRHRRCLYVASMSGCSSPSRLRIQTRQWSRRIEQLFGRRLGEATARLPRGIVDNASANKTAEIAEFRRQTVSGISPTSASRVSTHDPRHGECARYARIGGSRNGTRRHTSDLSGQGTSGTSHSR